MTTPTLPKLSLERIRFESTAFIYRAGAILFFPWDLFCFAQFFYFINKHKSKRSKGIAWPRKIAAEVYLSYNVPADFVSCLELRGIAMFHAHGWLRWENDRPQFRYPVWVSSNQHFMADREARANGFVIVTPPVKDASGNWSHIDAAKGSWKPSGNVRAPSNFNDAGIRMIAGVLGPRKEKRSRFLAEPGIRQPRAPTSLQSTRQRLGAWLDKHDL